MNDICVKDVARDSIDVAACYGVASFKIQGDTNEKAGSVPEYRKFCKKSDG
jgi:hypothetical protein